MSFARYNLEGEVAAAGVKSARRVQVHTRLLVLQRDAGHVRVAVEIREQGLCGEDRVLAQQFRMSGDEPEELAHAGGLEVVTCEGEIHLVRALECQLPLRHGHPYPALALVGGFQDDVLRLVLAGAVADDEPLPARSAAACPDGFLQSETVVDLNLVGDEGRFGNRIFHGVVPCEISTTWTDRDGEI